MVGEPQADVGGTRGAWPKAPTARLERTAYGSGNLIVKICFSALKSNRAFKSSNAFKSNKALESNKPFENTHETKQVPLRKRKTRSGKKKTLSKASLD